ncbi:hypothetical protein IFM89_023261 [Coptis chinensis]|uniref:Myb/SANT-like domain-containing protein n=1 Tax=Coptis chinensis TaxID=261450 RepID=A0A835I3F0_9MAGN|nr:hypothetical protein IFM89_023261 [Coptis chinensis]
MANDCESRVKTEDKKGKMRWTTAMDNVLLGMLVETTRDGKKCGMNKWQDSMWKSIRPTLSEIAEEEVQQSHIDNRLRQMRLEYRNFLELKGRSGVAYIPAKQELEASNDYWGEIMKNEVSSFALNGMDDINSNTIEDSHDQQATCENNDVEEVEDSMSSKSTKKRPSSSSTKPPPKKEQNTNEVIEILEGVKKNLEKLREIVDPLTFGKQLRDDIFGVEGFSVRFLNAVFQILMKDRSEAEIFILTDEEGRKDILHDFRGRIGEL